MCQNESERGSDRGTLNIAISLMSVVGSRATCLCQVGKDGCEVKRRGQGVERHKTLSGQ